MQEHCWKEHAWANPRKRGRPYQGDNTDSQPWQEGVWCQKFQLGGQLARLFEVSPPSTEGTQHPADEEGDDDNVERALEASFRQGAAALQQAQRAAHVRVEADSNRYVWHGWLQRTQWARHLARFDRRWLLQQVQQPGEQERALGRVCWAVERVIWKAQRASSPDVVGLPAATFIERREVGAPSSEKPFNALQTGKTMKKYSRYWVSIVSYVWRTHKLPSAEATAADDGSRPTASYAGDRKPRYCLSAGQTMALWRVGQAASAARRGTDSDSNSDSELDDEGEEELERRVLALLVSLLDHHLRDDYYQSALVSATAVLGVDRNCGWKPPPNYTTLLSGVVTVAKMLVLYSAVQARKREVADLVATQGWGPQDAADMATSHFDLVRQSVTSFMTLTDYGGRPTPMDWVLRLRAYGKGANKETNAVGHVLWVGDEILYGYVRYSMPQLRSMIHGLVASTRAELQRDLLLLDVDASGDPVEGATVLPAVEWDKLVDNPAELRSGWNFLQDPRNTFGGVDGASWLTGRVVCEKKLRRAFVDTEASTLAIAAGHGVAWVKQRVEQYERAMRLFREHLLVAMHMTGGQPARGTEVVTTTYMNQPNGQSRGIFVEDGLMAYVTMYHKGVGHSGRAKVIHRYLPQEVGELLLYYLWMVLPFWQRLERALGREVPPEPSPFIWEPIKEAAWTGPQQKKRKKRKQLPPPPLGESRDDGESEDEETPTLSAASGRTEQWGTNQVRRAMERASLHRLNTKLNLQIWRHNTVAIIERYVRDRAVLKTLRHGDHETDDAENDPFHLQSAHTTRTVGQVYGRPADESPWSVQSQRKAFRQVSIAWHQFLQFESTLSTSQREAPAAAAQQERQAARQEHQGASDEQFRRWRQMRETDIQASLEQLQGRGAQFRGCQRPVIEAIMQQKSPIVAVMGTGCGKSLAFMLPALTSTGVTVLVVPLVALKSNLRDRCVRAGISCVEWSSEHPHEWAQIVLVVPEVAVGAPFQSFLNRQRGMGHLDRVVVDECHVVLESTQGWRAQVLKLRTLVQAETQLVYLTATLKLKEESEFIQLMALPPKEESHWFRARTTRPNIAYSVHRFNQADEDEADVLARLVHEEQYPLPGQIVVYCDSVQKTKRYAAMLGAVCFHRELGTTEEKLALLRQLTDGLQHVFVATSALGLGIDCSTIRHVLFVGQIRRLRDLVQQSGRAGRDGAPSKAPIIRGAVYAPNGKRRAGSRFREVEADVHEVVEGDGCIRVVIDREMDGHARQACRRGEEACSWCREQGIWEEGESEAAERAEAAALADEQAFRGRLAARRSLGRRETALQAQEQLEVQKLEEMLEAHTGGCSWCRVNAWAGMEQHQLTDCTQEGSDDVRGGVRELQARLQWARYSCCFDCGVPQAICTSYTERLDAGWDKIPGARCQFAGVLVPLVIAIWVLDDCRFTKWVQARMQREGIWHQDTGPSADFDQMVLWMASLVRWGGIQSNRMCWVLVQFTMQSAE
jgi:superfamily II DNA helicase RecQ